MKNTKKFSTERYLKETRGLAWNTAAKYLECFRKVLKVAKGENTVDWTGIAAGGSIAVIPVIILFVLMQKHFVEGIAGAVKS